MMSSVPEPMEWATRLIAGGIGAVASFLAIGISPPASHREGCFRVAVGFFVTFVGTGYVCEKLGESDHNLNVVLAIAGALGVGAWWFMAAFISFAKNSDVTFLTKLAGFFIGQKSSPKEKE